MTPKIRHTHTKSSFSELSRRGLLRDLSSREYTYPEIPSHYTWDNRSHSWNKRKRTREDGSITNDGLISRLYNVSPREDERYYLRLLLLHVKGAKGFEDFRTVNGALCVSYRDAALALGLLEYDNEWHDCLNEASESEFPSALRLLFATILYHCSPSDPLRLWTSFADKLSEDYLFSRKDCAGYRLEDAHRDALADVDDILKGMGSSISEIKALSHLPLRRGMDQQPDQHQHPEIPEPLEDRAMNNISIMNERY